jgi:hypothetical protein
MLKRIPNEKDLARIYFELSEIGARSLGKKCRWPYPKMDKYALLVLAAEMSRYDPRLLGILVEYFIDHWRDINPVKLRRLYTEMKNPEVFGVVGEFLRNTTDDKEVAPYFYHLIDGLKPAPLQFYFHGLYRVGGRLAKRAAESSLAEYKRWGFLASEQPILGGKLKRPIGTLDKDSRINLLRDLIEKKEVITISDYLKLLGHTISRQQALIDLNKCGFARKFGQGRGSKWKLSA